MKSWRILKRFRTILQNCMNKILSWFLHLTLRPIIYGLFVKETRGRENIPATNYILASNHLSHLDEVIVGSICTPRRFHFIGQVDNYSGAAAVIRDFIYWFSETIPLNRKSKESGIQALQTAEKYLKNGDIVLMYPEGTRARDGVMAKGKKGIAVLATNTGVPVLPVAITGTYELNPPESDKFKIKKIVKLKIGKPMYFHEETKKIQSLDKASEEYKNALQDVTDKIMSKIGQMKDELDHGD